MIHRYGCDDAGIDPDFGVNSALYYFTDDGFHLHTHTFVELVIILDGSGVHLTTFGESPLSSGDSFVVQGDVAHGFANAAGMTMMNILFTRQYLEKMAFSIRSFEGFQKLFESEPHGTEEGMLSTRVRLGPSDLSLVRRRADGMCAELARLQPGYQGAVSAHWLHVVTHLCRVVGGQEGIKLPTPVAGAVDFMRENLSDKLSLETLASQANLSKNQFTRVFSRRYHTTPIQYLRTLRVDWAKELLGTTDRSLTDIALTTGFGDSSHFSRTFKQIVGVSPREFRKAVSRDEYPSNDRDRSPYDAFDCEDCGEPR